MDEYGSDNNMIKLIIGLVIGLVLLMLVIPLAANVIATHEVESVASNVLENMTLYESTIPAAASQIVETTDSSDSVSSNSQNTVKNSQSSAKNTGSEDYDYSIMHIKSGSITTGSSLSSKTECKVYVGKEFAGANVKISTVYYRDDNRLNPGLTVPKTVDSKGYITVKSANAFELYPDTCEIELCDSNGRYVDVCQISLETRSGTQKF